MPMPNDGLALDILVECQLGTGQQADRDMRLADCPRNRVVMELANFVATSFVLDLGRPGSRHGAGCSHTWVGLPFQ